MNAPNRVEDLDEFEKQYAAHKTEYSALYDVNGNLVVARHGGEKSIEFSSDELDRAKGGVLSHTHPHGHSLSSADLEIAQQHQLEMRATGITPRGFRTYVVKPGLPDPSLAVAVRSDFEKLFKSLKKGKASDYEPREEAVRQVAKKYGMAYRQIKRDLVVREGLETEEQRAWWFWNLKDGSNYTPGGSDKVMPAPQPKQSAWAKSLEKMKKEKQNQQSEAPAAEKPKSGFEAVKADQAKVQAAKTQAAKGQEGTEPNQDKGKSQLPTPMEQGQFVGMSTHQFNNLSLDERHAVKDYTGTSYEDFNSYLRTGKVQFESELDEVKGKVSLIQKAIDKSPIPKDMSVYRGFSEKRYKDLQIGSTLEDKGLISTTINPMTAEKFYKDEQGNPFGLERKVFKIDLPKGHPGLAINGKSNVPSENELLLNPSKFVVRDITSQQVVRNTAQGRQKMTMTTYHLSPVTSKTVKEGLETDDQRAWYFWHLKNEEGVESSGSSSGDSSKSVQDNFQNDWRHYQNDKNLAYQKVAQSHFDSMTPNQQEAVGAYVGHGNPAVNQYLRGQSVISQKPEKMDVETQSKRMDKAISNHIVEPGTIMYRGISDSYPVGTVITDKGYMSTSLSAYHASSFSGTSPKGEDYILRIKAGEGQHGLYSDKANVMAEHEVILPRGTSLRIDKVEAIDYRNSWGTPGKAVIHYASIVKK